MNFIKPEGKPIADYLDIKSKDFQSKLEFLLNVNHELLNDGAYILDGDSKYINKTFAYRTHSLQTLFVGTEDLFKEIVDYVGKFEVSFRKPITIVEYSDGSYDIRLRLTAIKHPEFTIKKE